MASNCRFCSTPLEHDLVDLGLSPIANAFIKSDQVSDDEALKAMAHAFLRLKLVAEPGGAVALAAALFRADEIEGGDVIAIISGGNVDARASG